MSRTVNLGKVVPQKGIDYWTETEQNEIISTATTNVENNFAPTIATIQSNSNNALNTANTANSTANTAKSIAEGANQALSYANYQAMIIAFNSLADDVYRIGQNVMIVTLNVPDLWISEIEQTSEAYTYTTDEAFTTLLQTNGYVKVGYYRLSPLETQKVDLTDYYTKEDTVSKISEMISVDDVQINGTSIVSDGVANVPIATASSVGVVRTSTDRGTMMTGNILGIRYAESSTVKAGTNSYRPIVPNYQHESTFYGLAKSAGDTTQSQSSNAVGVYTEDAKIAIQKMLGIYEAPWELIREDTFTNEEEADHVISTDMNGEPFELTDVRIIFWLPQQETVASKKDSGRITFEVNSNTREYAYLGEWTQQANAALRGGWAEIIQANGMIELHYIRNSSDASLSNNMVAPFRSTNAWNHFVYDPNGRAYNRVIITKVTGTGRYRLYGRRKWN